MGIRKNQYIERNCLKRGFGHFADLRGLGKGEGNGIFEEGGG